MALTAEQVTILNSSFQPTMQFIYFYVNLGLFFFPSDIYRGVAWLHLYSESNLFFK